MHEQPLSFPSWFTALLAELYPQRPTGMSLLTLALRPAATMHLQVQPMTDEELLTGHAERRLMAKEYPLPTPLYSEGRVLN